MKKSNNKGRWRLPSNTSTLTSVVLHSGVVGDTLWSEAEAQDVTRIRAVSYQERTIWFPFQFHLCIFPIHWSPIPTTLLKTKSGQVVNRTKKGQRFQHNLSYSRRTSPFNKLREKLPRVSQPLAMNIRLIILSALQSYRRIILQFHYQGCTKKRDAGQLSVTSCYIALAM